MDENGNFDKDIAMTHVRFLTDGDEDKINTASEIIDHCTGTVAEDDKCEVAEQYDICFMEQAKSHNIDDIFEM